MTYDNIYEGIFLSRPNRFIAEVMIESAIHRCHVKNTGRCKELLIPGVKVYVERSYKPERVTQFDLISVLKGDILVNIDSSAPNKVFHEYLGSGLYLPDVKLIKKEAIYLSSRFDFYVEAGSEHKTRKTFIEVKGVTLEVNGTALFPDAPTERGVKHLNELIECTRNGYEAHVVFVIQMKGTNSFSPNYVTHSAFGETLKSAYKAGVKVTALDCIVSADSLHIANPIPIVV